MGREPWFWEKQGDRQDGTQFCSCAILTIKVAADNLAMATLTLEISDLLLSKLQQTGQPLQDIILQAVEAYVSAQPPVDLTQTQTWKLCGQLQVSSPAVEFIVGQDEQGQPLTNYAEHIDEVLY
jgi:hypothetical protein